MTSKTCTQHRVTHIERDKHVEPKETVRNELGLFQTGVCEVCIKVRMSHSDMYVPSSRRSKQSVKPL